MFKYFIVTRPQSTHDFSSDGIQFVNSDGEVVENDDENEDDETNSISNDQLHHCRSPKPEVQIMYIQMEFCEKSTLR